MVDECLLSFIFFITFIVEVVLTLPSSETALAVVGNQQHALIVASRCSNDSEILQKILVGYNENKVPSGGINVEVEAWIQEITTVSDITSDFEMDIYISETWLDPALSYYHMNP